MILVIAVPSPLPFSLPTSPTGRVAPKGLELAVLVHRFIEQAHLHIPRVAQRISTHHVFRESRKASQRVAWQYSPPMTNDVPVVIVLTRFNQVEI